MRVADGRFLDGRGTRGLPAWLEREADRWSVRDGHGALLAGPAAVDALEVTPGVGGTPWLVRFPGGGLFEAPETPGLAALLPRRTAFVRRLESRLPWALAALLVTAAAVYGAVRWGVPAVARAAAERLPPELLAASGREALRWMDGRLFAPSRLDPGRRAALAARIEALAARHAPGYTVRVRFRRMGGTANAFALPSGDIVLTDRLVEILDGDGQVLAVAAHELGHLAHRHALRETLQHGILTTAVFMLAGDLSGVTGLLASLPVMLVELGYSRAMEREADAWAVRLLRAEGLEPALLASALGRIEANACAAPAAEGGDRKAAGGDGGCPDLPGWLSTHPLTEDRIRAILAHDPT